MFVPKFSKLAKFFIALFLGLAVSRPGFTQENLGTAMGIPNGSPGIMWPRGSSLESLGTGRLYPNGPEFGLSNTSGGFGVTGTGRASGVGLAERTLPGLAGQELDRPFTEFRRLTDAFSAERSRSSNLFSTAVGGQFRFEMQRSSFGLTQEAGVGGGLVQPSQFTSIDATLQDRSSSADSILKTGP